MADSESVLILDADVLKNLAAADIRMGSGTKNLDRLFDYAGKVVLTSTVRAEVTTLPDDYQEDKVLKGWIDQNISREEFTLVTAPDHIAGSRKNIGEQSIVDIAIPRFGNHTVTVASQDKYFNKKNRMSACQKNKIGMMQKSL